jgi:excisionase family DNA binding protein
MCGQAGEKTTMLTLGQASDVLDVPKGTLRRLADRGAIRVCRTGKRGDRRFRPQDVAVFLLMENKGFLLNWRGRDGDAGKTTLPVTRELLSSLRKAAPDRTGRTM